MLQKKKKKKKKHDKGHLDIAIRYLVNSDATHGKFHQPNLASGGAIRLLRASSPGCVTDALTQWSLRSNAGIHLPFLDIFDDGNNPLRSCHNHIQNAQVHIVCQKSTQILRHASDHSPFHRPHTRLVIHRPRTRTGRGCCSRCPNADFL